MTPAFFGTEGDADYGLLKFIIADQSEALENYRDNATESDADAAKEYTDGYAIVAEVILAAELFEGATLADDASVTMTNDICITGTMTADASGDVAINATSCARASATCTGNGTGGAQTEHTCVYSGDISLYSKTVASPENEDTAADWDTAMTNSDGFDGTWIWTGLPADATHDAIRTTDITLKVGRMFPKLEKKTYSATDLRFSADVVGKVGYQLDGAGFVWPAANWNSAAQVASVAAAAAVVALTF